MSQANAKPGGPVGRCRFQLVSGRAKTCRDNTRYQATAVPNSANVSSTRNATGAPSRAVTGASGNASPQIDVFAMRLTPAGAFIRSVQNGSDTARPLLSTIVGAVEFSGTVPVSTSECGPAVKV